MNHPPKIKLPQAEKKVYDLGLPRCTCIAAAHGVSEQRPELPPAMRQLRGSLSLLVCAACGGLRSK